jgi:hypothetical protein
MLLGRWSAALLVVVAFSRPAAARAEEATPPAEVTERPLDPGARPFRFALHGSLLTGYPDLVGLSASVRMPDVPVEVQAGLWTTGLSGAFYGRVGYAFHLSDKRTTAGRGWTHDMPLMLGFFSGNALHDPGFRGADLTLHFDNTYWFMPYFGLSTLLTLGGGLSFNDDPSSASYGHASLYPTLRLAAGVAF